MSSKIRLAFEKCKRKNRPALITYVVAGDNNKQNSIKILKSIANHADILELGFPHNTPIADGGQIQGSSYRSKKRYKTFKDVFEIVKKIQKKFLFKTINIDGILQYNISIRRKQLFKRCKSSGVDGLIVVDLPWPENKLFAQKCKENQ